VTDGAHVHVWLCTIKFCHSISVNLDNKIHELIRQPAMEVGESEQTQKLADSQ